MAGMRNRLIHGYDVIDNEIVWVIAKDTIPGIPGMFTQLSGE